MQVEVKFNNAKNGIELHFPANPGRGVLDNIKANGFRWGKYNRCWYIKDSSTARDFITRNFPGSITEGSRESQEARDTAAYVAAQENAFFDNWAASHL